MRFDHGYLHSDKYKYVFNISIKKYNYWFAKIPQFNYSKSFKTEREAAIAVDKKFIEMGLFPINILKRK